MDDRPPTVLVVEDETDVRDLWGQALRPLGLQVLEASGVAQALRTLKREAVDILVLDWVLGDDTGEIVMDSWVGNGGGPLCVVSGVVGLEGLTPLLSKGAYNVLTKPVATETIVAVVGRYVTWVRVLRELRIMRIELAKMRRLVIAAVTIAVASRAVPLDVLAEALRSLM